MNKQDRSRKKAFTLIELLVVIAIIGILAAALFPAVSGAIVRANATAMGNRGKNIVMAIISSNIEREQFSLSPIWPNTGGEGYPDAFNYSSAVQYFADMIDPDGSNRKRIENIDYTYFAGGGVSAAPDRAAFTSDGETHMAWRTMFNIRETDSDSAPFLMTRNMDITTLPTGEDEEFDVEYFELDPEENPFGSRMMVWVMKGGAVQSVRPELLMEAVEDNPDMFLPKGALNENAEFVFP